MIVDAKYFRFFEEGGWAGGQASGRVGERADERAGGRRKDGRITLLPWPQE